MNRLRRSRELKQRTLPHHCGKMKWRIFVVAILIEYDIVITTVSETSVVIDIVCTAASLCASRQRWRFARRVRSAMSVARTRTTTVTRCVSQGCGSELLLVLVGVWYDEAAPR